MAGRDDAHSTPFARTKIAADLARTLVAAGLSFQPMWFSAAVDPAVHRGAQPLVFPSPKTSFAHTTGRCQRDCHHRRRCTDSALPPQASGNFPPAVDSPFRSPVLLLLLSQGGVR